MNDDPRTTRASVRTELAERAGRLEFFTGQLVALAQLRNQVPPGFLRERLQQFAEQATRRNLVNPDDVAQYVATLREQAEYWRERHGGA